MVRFQRSDNIPIATQLHYVTLKAAFSEKPCKQHVTQNKAKLTNWPALQQDPSAVAFWSSPPSLPWTDTAWVWVDGMRSLVFVPWLPTSKMWIKAEVPFNLLMFRVFTKLLCFLSWVCWVSPRPLPYRFLWWLQMNLTSPTLLAILRPVSS